MGVFASMYHVSVVHMDPLEPDLYATAWGCYESNLSPLQDRLVLLTFAISLVLILWLLRLDLISPRLASNSLCS